MRTLKVISGPAAGESLGIEKEVVIGREGADLTITDPQISRRHTALRPVENGVEVEDLGSLNGTFVNGQRLTAPMTLRTSGKIQVGDSEIEIDVESDGATQMAPAVAVAEARGSVRRVEEPPAAVAPAAAAAAAEPAARVSAPPVAPPPRSPGPPPLAEGPPVGRPAFVRWLPLLLLLIAAGVAAALYFGLRDDDAVTAHKLIASVRTADMTQGKTAITFAGEVHQEPGGLGVMIGRINLASDITAAKTIGKAVKITSGSMIFRFDDGRIDATLTGTATRRADKTTDLIITGKIIRGIREFEGAKGSFSMKSNQEVATVPTVGIGSFEGTIRY